MDSLKMENASHRWSRGNVDENIKALKTDDCSALKAVAEFARENVTQVVQLNNATFSERWKQLMKQPRWIKTHILNDLKTSLPRFDADTRCEVTKCVATFFYRLRAIYAAGSEVSSLAMTKSGNETLECGLGKGIGSGAGSSNVEGSSSRYFRRQILLVVLSFFRFIFQ